MGNPRRVYIYPPLDQDDDAAASPYWPPGVTGFPQAPSNQTQSASPGVPEGYLSQGGGLLGMLLRGMQEGGDRPDADSISDPAGVAVGDSDNTGNSQVGLLDRLTAPQLQHAPYQPFAGNSQTSSQSKDPNFRQVSRAPIAIRAQSMMTPPNRFAYQVRQSDFDAQPGRSLSDRMQAYWDHPDPHGVISALKGGLTGIAQAVQGSIDATSAPSTEEEAFRQKLGREQGPIGAWQALSLLSPRVPRGAGGIFARPLMDVMTNRGLPLRVGEQIATPGVKGVPSDAGTLSAIPGNARLPAQFPNSSVVGNRLGPMQSVPQVGNRSGSYSYRPSLPWISAPTTVPAIDRGGMQAPSIDPVPPTSVSTFPEWLARKTLPEHSGNGGDGDKSPLPWIPGAPGIEAGINGSQAAPRRKSPSIVPELPMSPEGQETSPASSGSGGGGNNDKRCEKERQAAIKSCAKEAMETNNWKIGYGPKYKDFSHCVRSNMSELCGGTPVSYGKWKPKGKRRSKK